MPIKVTASPSKIAGTRSHVMTFEVGKVLDDPKWQAPVYCFGNNAPLSLESTFGFGLNLMREVISAPMESN